MFETMELRLKRSISVELAELRRRSEFAIHSATRSAAGNLSSIWTFSRSFLSRFSKSKISNWLISKNYLHDVERVVRPLHRVDFEFSLLKFGSTQSTRHSHRACRIKGRYCLRCSLQRVQTQHSHMSGKRQIWRIYWRLCHNYVFIRYSPSYL